MSPETIQKIETKDLQLINVSRVSKTEMDYLKKEFRFHQVHLEDCLAPYQRPKLDVYHNYIFMVLIFPL